MCGYCRHLDVCTIYHKVFFFYAMNNAQILIFYIYGICLMYKVLMFSIYGVEIWIYMKQIVCYCLT